MCETRNGGFWGCWIFRKPFGLRLGLCGLWCKLTFMCCETTSRFVVGQDLGLFGMAGSVFFVGDDGRLCLIFFNH